MDTEKCRVCDGAGEIECPACDRKTVITFAEDDINKWDSCSCCNGKGKIKCRKCNGTGQVKKGT